LEFRVLYFSIMKTHLDIETNIMGKSASYICNRSDNLPLRRA